MKDVVVDEVRCPSETAGGWRQLVDENVPASKSLLGRYWRALERLELGVSLSAERVARASLREGAQILHLRTHRGVEIDVCDESSLMTTGTYKDLDACLVSVLTTAAEVGQVAVSSGGNLGYALSVYGAHVGLRSFFFQPKTTMYKLDATSFAWGGAKLISVDLPERQVKSLTAAFARNFNIVMVPDIRWRLAASAVRAMFILEHTEARRVDWLAQTMCAGYGPAGIYNCFSELVREGMVDRLAIPKFLGFQQDANAPMVNAWAGGHREIMAAHIQPQPDQYIEPGLYNTNPERNYTRLFDLMRHYGGDLRALDRDAYDRYGELALGWLRDVGLNLTRVPGRPDEILEKTGLLTLVGVIAAIEEGRLEPGQRILAMVTGGFRQMSGFNPPTPDVEVDASLTEEAWVHRLGEHFGLRPFTYSRQTDRLYPR